VVYHDLVEFANPKTWPAIAPQLIAYYQAANEEARAPDAAEETNRTHKAHSR
jgi:hypothetical protein